MKKQINRIVGIVLALITVNSTAQNAREVIANVVQANGGVDALYKLRDVSFDYTFKVTGKNIVDISNERYIFNGEVSYANYSKREVYALPQIKGNHSQFFNGNTTVSKVNGKMITEQQPAYIGHSLRKTNYYWFAMMFKLLDPGVNHKLLPSRKVDGINYKIVEMTFGENVGDASDKYILYVNPKTNRIDQFLYTALAFGAKDPSLMKVKYEKIDGVYVTTYRKYAPADWDGKVIKENWIEQFTRNVKFNNGFDLTSIQAE
ncbi:hypothetical protein [uncultured Tenacibaculum sp.]|uniref:hypothetical protein n=1 Tax=uncultured Tenacibaculum sp. TaxID=174713 RepID=UPI002615C90C|nr:hypothetical protein [uncultured Tenacibaculum sp.]